MILYGSTLSPFVRKVVAFAAEKGVTFDLRPGGMGRGGADFAEASPFGKIPALRDPGADRGRDFCLSDSTAIIAYVDALHPEPNLIPTHPIERARTIWYEEFADTLFVAPGAKSFFNRFVAPKILGRAGDLALAEQAEREELPRLYDYLERMIPASGFLVADRLTLADIAVASPFANLAHIDRAIDPARWPRTHRYTEAILARPSFAGVIEQEKAFVAGRG